MSMIRFNNSSAQGEGSAGAYYAIGLPQLPPRSTRDGKRRLMTPAIARRELDAHLAEARREALERLQSLDAQSDHLADARQELAYLRHGRGPKFQLSVLVELDCGKIDPVINPAQSSLERVLEIGAAIGVAIRQYQAEAVEAAMRRLHIPVLPDDVAAEYHALAELFLSNSARENFEDQRFAKAQRLVDQANERAATVVGVTPKRLAQATEATRAIIADLIRRGELELISQI